MKYQPVRSLVPGAGSAQHYIPFSIPLTGLRVQIKQNLNPDLFSLLDENIEMQPITPISTANPRVRQMGRGFGEQKCHVEDPEIHLPLHFAEVPKRSNSMERAEPFKANKNSVARNTLRNNANLRKK
jgi:hypothetical protein